MSTVKKDVILKVEDLHISFHTDNGRVKAVRGVNFEVHKGEVLCIVGESGSGKSVTAKTIMGILPGNGRIDHGHVYYEGEDLTKVSEEEFHRIRGKKIGMIFQDPLSSLNPIMKVGKQITEAMIINSNKLKKMYQDLISDKLVKYNNEKALRDRTIEQSKDDILIAKRRLKKERENVKTLNISAEEKRERVQKLREELAQTRAQSAKTIKEIKEQTRENIAKYKQELKLRKKEAKVEVKNYSMSLKMERDNALSTLKAQLKTASTETSKAQLKKQIAEVKQNHINKTRITRAEAKKRALKVMTEVGIPQPERRYKQYPFEFSGGMRQRIVIAIALTQDPDVLICDEPTTALDVTIQAQILELIQRLTKERGLTVMFITHDLGVVANMADRVAVMYAGKIVEIGTAHDIFYDPRHPYTWALLSSIPDVDSAERLEAIPGTPPNMIFPPKGDAFALRSKYAMAIDFKEEPPMFKISDTHYAATWLLDKRAPKAEMPKIVSQRIKNSLKKAGERNG